VKRNELLTDAKMGEPGKHYVKWKKPATKEHIYVNIKCAE
jgi:hypothetical protein